MAQSQPARASGARSASVPVPEEGSSGGEKWADRDAPFGWTSGHLKARRPAILASQLRTEEAIAAISIETCRAETRGSMLAFVMPEPAIEPSTEGALSSREP
ncbi:hypothetical protein TgHK011_000583 [Trichoderma gracile]|nr:hypothetical protein TgHK011_000583 [Trichoderma gracile]